MHASKSASDYRRICSNCGKPLQRIGLSGRDYGLIHIDLCESCTLIWFDNNESDRLSRAGLVELISIISKNLQQPRDTSAQKGDLNCPECHAHLRSHSIRTLHGNFSRMQCPQEHGAYQTYLSFFAELGFFRPITWDDIARLSAAGKSIHCIQCGAEQPHQPQTKCSFCHSPVGILDPDRMARSLDVENTGWHIPSQQPATHWQTNCPTCGVSVDFVKHLSCPNCQSVLPPKQFESALKAGVAAAKHLPLERTRYGTESPPRKARFAGAIFILALLLFWLWQHGDAPKTSPINPVWAPEGQCTSLHRVELRGDQLTLHNGPIKKAYSRYKTDPATGRLFFEPQEDGVSIAIGPRGDPTFLDISNNELDQKFPFSGLRLTHCSTEEVWAKPALADHSEVTELPELTQSMHALDTWTTTPSKYRMPDTYLGAWGPEGNCSLRSGVFVEEEKVILVHGNDTLVLSYAFINKMKDPRSEEEKKGEPDDPTIDARLYSPKFPNKVSVLMTLARSRSLGGRQFVAMNFAEPEIQTRFPVFNMNLDRYP